MSNVQWKNIPGYEGIYMISNNGDVLNLETGKIRKLKPSKNGYVYVDLYKNGEVSWKRVHRLVAECFVENPYNYDIVLHLDNNKNNNNYTNLKWGTISENTRQAYDDGLIKPLFKTYEVYNDFFIKEIEGLVNLCESIGYSKSSISTYINNNETIKRGKYQGFKIRIK